VEEGREGKGKRERLFSSHESGESLRGRKAQESKRSRPELIVQGSKEGHGFFGGRKPLKHREEAGRFFSGVQEWRERLGKGFSITGEEKSSEGRSPRALGAERGFQGSGG